MDKFYNETLSELETAINDLEVDVDCSIQRVEAVIHHIFECLSELYGTRHRTPNINSRSMYSYQNNSKLHNKKMGQVYRF